MTEKTYHRLCAEDRKFIYHMNQVGIVQADIDPGHQAPNRETRELSPITRMVA